MGVGFSVCRGTCCEAMLLWVRGENNQFIIRHIVRQTFLQQKKMMISKFCFDKGLSCVVKYLAIYGMMMAVLGIIGEALLFPLPFLQEPIPRILSFLISGVGLSSLSPTLSGSFFMLTLKEEL